MVYCNIAANERTELGNWTRDARLNMGFLRVQGFHKGGSKAKFKTFVLSPHHLENETDKTYSRKNYFCKGYFESICKFLQIAFLTYSKTLD